MKRLQELLGDGIRYDPHYMPSMNSDHMPMTLCAITGLGGDARTCNSYRDDYRKILHEIKPAEPAANWRDGLGESGMYPSLLSYFQRQVSDHGIESTVARYLPQLISSMALDAFHPIIRLGYAIDFQSEDETAAALAYLVSCHREVPVDVNTDLEFEHCMRDQVSAGPRTFSNARFGERIGELLQNNEYPVGTASCLNDCAAVSMDIYRSTRNFFALHLVTATQAIRICAGIIDENLVLASLTGALLAAHQVVGSPAFDRYSPLSVPDHLDREHTYKYVWTCLSEYRHYGDDRYKEEIRGFRDKSLVPAWCASSEIP
jgi:Questin oxidase-like